ncbi:MAG TPA: VOC family protein [Propionicimonas sp.]|nr:VOC family protein [Propionicimonas sp.]
MRIQSVTVGLPCADIGRSLEWYRTVFGFVAPGIEPAPGVVEFKVGPIWLQLIAEPVLRNGAQPVVRFGVIDAEVERERLLRLGLPAGDLQQVEGVLEYFEFSDSDGNLLSMYAEVEP